MVEVVSKPGVQMSKTNKTMEDFSLHGEEE